MIIRDAGELTSQQRAVSNTVENAAIAYVAQQWDTNTWNLYFDPSASTTSSSGALAIVRQITVRHFLISLIIARRVGSFINLVCRTTSLFGTAPQMCNSTRTIRLLVSRLSTLTSVRCLVRSDGRCAAHANFICAVQPTLRTTCLLLWLTKPFPPESKL